jgi:hypothetical protein
MAHQFTTSYIEESLAIFHQYRRLGEKAIAQVADTDLTRTIDAEANSIATIVKHMAGNMRSRWTDFLVSDGEKPNRNRDAEFEAPPASRDELMAMWNEGWDLVEGAVKPLSDADLGRTITIRGEPHSVMQAINRQLAHYASHVGQIILLAKHYQGEAWTSLSIPRHRSQAFNEKVAAGEASQR